MTRVVRALLVALAVLVVVGSAPVAAATSPTVGGNLFVGPDETVGETTFVGGDATIAGTVEGDLTVIGGSFELAENATVTGDVTVIGGSVRVAGAVGGNVDVTAGTVQLEESATIDGDVRVAAGEFHLAGTVDGDVVADVEVLAVLEPATIGGDLVHAEDADVTIDEAAAIDGEIRTDLAAEEDPGVTVPDVGPFGLAGLWSLYVVGFWLLFGALILFVAPRFGDDVLAEVGGHPLRSLGVGFVGLFFIPAVLVALAVTIIGIPLALIGFLALAVLLAIATVMGRYAIGAWFLSRAGLDHRYLALFLGVVGLAFLDRIPYLGATVNFVVFLLGLGAVLVLLGRGVRTYRTPAE